MAAQGRSWRDILAQYFPGAEAADDSSGKVWQKFDRTGFSFETLNAADATFLNDLSRARAEAAQVSGLNSTRSFIVRSFSTTEAFRNATLVSGWTAAFTEGDWIATQSLTTLAARRLLIPTLRHEFLHSLLEDETGPHAPLWLREGLVELWNTDPGRRTDLQHGLPVMPLNALDAALSHATSESQSASAHHDAGIYAARLVDRYGRAQVLGWLRSGVPADAIVRIGQR